MVYEDFLYLNFQLLLSLVMLRLNDNLVMIHWLLFQLMIMKFDFHKVMNDSHLMVNDDKYDDDDDGDEFVFHSRLLNRII